MRLVYIGAVDWWIDTDLLYQLGQRHYVALFGEKRIELPDNVEWHSVAEYSSIGKIIYDGGFEVGIIPFKVNDLTRHVNNSKIYQYYACGLPVVSTLDNKASERNKVFVAKGNFLEQVELASKSTIDVIDIAKNNDWQQIANLFFECVK